MIFKQNFKNKKKHFLYYFIILKYKFSPALIHINCTDIFFVIGNMEHIKVKKL